MKAKWNAILLTAIALMLTALFLLANRAGQKGYNHLLMASPIGRGSPGLSPQKLEEFCAEEFLLTYELRQAGTIEAVGQRHSVNVVGTNSHYAGLMGYPLLDGGFFTGAAMDAKNRHIVLGEIAAFEIFGSTRIAGQTLKLSGEHWIVVGVIRDGDEKSANVYLPASLTGGSVDAVIALMDDTVTEAYAKNALKNIGITDSSHAFINLSQSAAAYRDRFEVALQIMLIAVLLLIAHRIAGGLKSALRFYRARLSEFYLGELVTQYRMDVLHVLGRILLLAGACAAMLVLSLRMLGVCLTWQELVPITGELTAGAFCSKLVWLRDAQLAGNALFGACVGTVALWLSYGMSFGAWRPGKEGVILGESKPV